MRWLLDACTSDFFYFFNFSGSEFPLSEQSQTWPNSKRYTSWWSRSHSHSGHLRHPCPALASIHPDTHLRIARACWMVTSLFCDSFGQIYTCGLKNPWRAMKLPWKIWKPTKTTKLPLKPRKETKNHETALKNNENQPKNMKLSWKNMETTLINHENW